MKFKAKFFQLSKFFYEPFISILSSHNDENKNKILIQKIWITSKYFISFRPPSYTLAAQARKLVHKKITYLKKIALSYLLKADFAKFDSNHPRLVASKKKIARQVCSHEAMTNEFFKLDTRYLTKDKRKLKV